MKQITAVSRGSNQHPQWQVKKRGKVVAVSLIQLLQNVFGQRLHTALLSDLVTGIPWHPMASHGIPWHPMVFYQPNWSTGNQLYNVLTDQRRLQEPGHLATSWREISSSTKVPPAKERRTQGESTAVLLKWSIRRPSKPKPHGHVAFGASKHMGRDRSFAWTENHVGNRVFRWQARWKWLVRALDRFMSPTTGYNCVNHCISADLSFYIFRPS